MRKNEPWQAEKARSISVRGVKDKFRQPNTVRISFKWIGFHGHE